MAKANKTQKPRKSNKTNKVKIKKSTKKKHRVRNWREYNEALKKRGELQVWIEEDTLKAWKAEPTHNQGRQPFYSDLAIRLTLQLGGVFNQKLRQTEGLVQSIFRLMNIELPVPDFSTLSRRSSSITVKLSKSNKENVVLVADSSGLKVFGEGEWKVRKHGYSKRRTWRKIHLIITPDGEIREAGLTENNISDDDAAVKLLDEETSVINAFLGDGAYDKRKIYDKCVEKEVKEILIPPQKNAKIWQHGNLKGPPHPRDENLRAIRKTSRERWKENTGYHRRSLVETTMFRFKTVFGDKLNARNIKRQRTELLIKVSILNKMREIGMPRSYTVN